MKSKEKIIQGGTPTIGLNVKKLRESCGMRNVDVVTQLQLKGIALSASTLSKIESGNSNPTTQLLIALTEIFRCDFNAFFEEEERPQETNKKESKRWSNGKG